MFPSELSRQLDRVGERMRRERAWMRLSVCWLVAAFLLLVVWLAEPMTGQWLSSRPVQLSGAVAVVILLLVVLVRNRRLDQRQVARQIERRFPDLDQRLLAAVELTPSIETGRFGFLQAQLLNETGWHGRRNDWSQTVPSRRLLMAFCVQLTCFASLAAVVLMTVGTRGELQADASHDAVELPPLTSVEYGLTIEPADTEIERGSGLLVLARFAQTLPADVTLVYSAAEQAPRRLPLDRSLDDPIFGGRIERVESDLAYHVEYDGRTSEEYRVSVFEFPRLERADFTVEFPDYPGLETTTLEDSGRVSVVEGSTVTLICRLNKPVQSARLETKHGTAIDLAPADGRRDVWRITLHPTEKSAFRLLLTDEAGRVNKQPPELVIDVLPNRPPDIKVTLPGKDLRVSPLEEVALEATAWDDFGITQYGVIYEVAGREPQTVTLGGDVAAKEETAIAHLLPLEPLGVVPDDLVSWYVFADDVGPDGRSRRTCGDMYFAEVRHFEEIFRQGMQPPGGGPQAGAGQNQQQIDQLIALQKQIVSATWNLLRGDTADNGPLAKDAAVIRDSQQSVLDQVEIVQAKLQDLKSKLHVAAVVGHMTLAVQRLTATADKATAEMLPAALSAEQAAYHALLKLRAREHQVSQGSSSGGSGGGGSGRSQSQLNQLELTNRENRYQTNKSAQSQQASVDGEQLQILNRLRELARRQGGMNDKLRELEAALRAAQTSEEREEIERRLKRLREQQQELLRDLDDVRDRMDRQENQPEIAESRRQLDETRQRIREASEALQNGQVSQALSSGTRAERQLDDLRDDFRRKTAGEFDDALSELREQSRQLSERERQLGEKLESMQTDGRRSLRASQERAEIERGLREQKAELERLFDRMREMVTQAEPSEPLLSRQLYDTVRTARHEQPGENLEAASQLLSRGLVPDAARAEQQAQRGIETLQEGIEQAADSVLGNELDSLKRASSELRDATEKLRDELAEAAQKQDGQSPGPSGKPSSGQPSGQGEQSGRETASNDSSQSQPASDGSSAGGSQRGNPADSTTQTGGQPGQPATKPPSFLQQGGLSGGPGGGPGGPLTGGDFQEWSDSLREIEELVEDSQLREQIGRAREQARSVRVEFKRHSKDPDWDLVKASILEPLVELQERLAEEIAQRESPESLVPLDRDPVPERFDDLVRRYYERLGEGLPADDPRYAEQPDERAIR